MPALTLYTSNQNHVDTDYNLNYRTDFDANNWYWGDRYSGTVFGQIAGFGITYDNNNNPQLGTINYGASINKDGTLNWAISDISIAANSISSLEYSITDSDAFDYYIVNTLLAGNDFIYGSAGNDLIAISYGVDVIDGGNGIDWTDFSGHVNTWDGATIDLAMGTYSNKGNSSYKFSGTLNNIENIQGTSGADTITGNQENNQLQGGNNSDTISGGDGNDTIIGGNDADSLMGGAGNDIFILSDATYNGDSVNGGSGTDTADFSGAEYKISVNIGAGTTIFSYSNYSQYTDHISEIENVIGTFFDDSLTGDTNNNILRGGSGNDTLDGATGSDTADYTTGYRGITVDLRTGSAVGQGTDKLLNIENITGSTYGDTLTGNTGANAIKGGGGNDTIDGDAGNDVLDGGAGSDWAYYNAITGTVGVTIDLSLTAAQNTVAAGKDTLKAIENLLGSSNADKLTGDANANVLSGAAGADTLAGGVGNDTLIGGAGKDSLTGGAGNDVFKYITTTESAGINRDTITDFVVGTDKIDLSQVDADPLGATGDQAFTLLAQAKFTGVAGELIFAGSVLSGDVTADGVADFSIVLTGVTSLSAASLIL